MMGETVMHNMAEQVPPFLFLFLFLAKQPFLTCWANVSMLKINMNLGSMFNFNSVLIVIIDVQLN